MAVLLLAEVQNRLFWRAGTGRQRCGRDATRRRWALRGCGKGGPGCGDSPEPAGRDRCLIRAGRVSRWLHRPSPVMS